MRIKILLDGEWYFKPDPNDRGISERWYLHDRFEDWDKITVPGCWQALPKYENYHGVGWFARTFYLPKIDLRKRRAFIIFEAVNWRCDIWLNGTYIGAHEGGYEQFEFEVTNSVREGYNVLMLRVYLPKPDELREALIGKQSWYSYVGGPWQSVYLEFRGSSYISRYSSEVSLEERNIKFNVEIKDLPKIIVDKYFVEMEIIDPYGKRHISRKELPRVREEDLVKVSISTTLDKVTPWSTSNPALYKVYLRLIKGDEIIDEVFTRIGLRKIEVKDNKLFINNRPVYIVGILDQDFHPSTIYSIPLTILKKKIKAIKDMRFNLVRIHLKVPSKQYLNLCDEEGIMVWEEVPNAEVNSRRSRKEYLATLRSMIRRDRGHPCVIIWGLANEGWGLNIDRADDRKWLLDLYKITKNLDPSRPIVDNSGGPHIFTDINDFHIYPQLPERIGTFKEELDKIIGSPSYTFHEKALGPSGLEPIIISEIGFWSLPVKIHRNTRGGWESGSPRGFMERYKELKFDEIWKSYEELAIETQKHAYTLLKLAIEEIRSRKEISGYVITQLNDVFWECNGLLNFDYTEKPGISIRDIAKLNSPILLIIPLQRYTFWSQEILHCSILCSNISGESVQDGTLICKINDEVYKVLNIGEIGAYGVEELGTLRLRMPHVNNVKEAKLKVELLDKSGEVLASNEYRIFIIPENVVEKLREENVKVYDVSRVWPKEAIFPLVSKSDLIRCDLVIATGIDRALIDYIRKGGRSIVIITKNGRIEINGRKFEIETLRGGWITGFHYARRRRIVKPFMNGHIMGVEFMNILPELGIKGSKEIVDDEITGYFEGWIHNHHSTTLSVELGGLMILTTLRIANGLEDPLTYVVLENMIGELT